MYLVTVFGNFFCSSSGTTTKKYAHRICFPFRLHSFDSFVAVLPFWFYFHHIIPFHMMNRTAAHKCRVYVIVCSYYWNKTSLCCQFVSFVLSIVSLSNQSKFQVLRLRYFCYCCCCCFIVIRFFFSLLCVARCLWKTIERSQDKCETTQWHMSKWANIKEMFSIMRQSTLNWQCGDR